MKHLVKITASLLFGLCTAAVWADAVQEMRETVDEAD